MPRGARDTRIWEVPRDPNLRHSSNLKVVNAVWPRTAENRGVKKVHISDFVLSACAWR